MKNSIRLLSAAFFAAMMCAFNANAQTVTGTLQDSLSGDVNQNGIANPGDSVTYKAKVKVAGSNATGVQYNNPTPANTVLLPGTKTSPLARNDNFATPFNTANNSQNVLTNDFGVPAPTVVSWGTTANTALHAAGASSATPGGGTATVAANGALTYSPGTGFTGHDIFAYKATNGNAPDNNATVDIAVGNPASAVNDAYNVIGNVSISDNVKTNDGGDATSVTAVNGSGANVGVGITTAGGGNLTVNANGTFTYNPLAGFEGADNFTYAIDNGFNTPSTATVSITIAGMIWFVDVNAGSNGNGRLSSPFNNLASFASINNGTGNNPAANDNIFLYESAGNYTAGVTLLSGQKLIGQDATATLASITGVTVQSYTATLPSMNTGGNAATVVNAAGNGITLGNTNTVRGLTMGNCSSNAISGSSFGTLTVADLTINTTGQGLSLTTGALNGTIGSLTSSGGTNNVSLTSCTGSLTVSAGTLSGASGTSFNVNGGTCSVTTSTGITQSNNAAMVSINSGHATGTITFQAGTLSATSGTGLQFDNADGTYNFNGTNTLNGGDAGIDILNGSSGTFSFSGNSSITNPANEAIKINASSANVTYSGTFSKTGAATGILISGNTGGSVAINGTGTKTLSTSTASAISLTGNSNTTINFSGSNLSITTTSGTGFNATSNSGTGTISVQGSSNSINATSGGTALNVTSTTIGASNLNFQSISANGGTNGIVLNTTGSSGGLVVTGTSTTAGSGGTIQNCAAKGADIRNATGISLKNMNFTNNATANLGAAGTCGDALNGTNGPTNCNCNISLLSTSNVTLDNLSVTGSKQIGIDGNAVSNLTMTNLTVTGNGNEAFEDGVQLVNQSGTLTITGGTYRDNASNQFEIQNTTGALNLSANSATFSNTTFPVTGSIPSNSTSNSGLFVAASGSSSASITNNITNCTFDRIYAQAYRADMAGNVSMTVNVGPVSGAGNGNTFTNVGQGPTITGTSSGAVNYAIRNNSFQNNAAVVPVNGSTNQIGVSKSGSSANWNGIIENNVIGTAGATQSGCNTPGCAGISINNTNSTNLHKVSVISNTINRVNGSGITVTSGGGTDQSSASLVIQSNTIGNTEQGPGAANPAILVQSGSSIGTDITNTCANISSNTITGIWSLGTSHLSSIRVRSLVISPGSFSLLNYNPATDYPDQAGGTTATSGAAGTIGNVADFIRFVNPGVTSSPPTNNGASASQGTVAFTGSVSCQ